MRRHARIGAHIFYRPHRWGDGADEPRWGPGMTARDQRRTAGVPTPTLIRLARQISISKATSRLGDEWVSAPDEA